MAEASGGAGPDLAALEADGKSPFASIRSKAVDALVGRVRAAEAERDQAQSRDRYLDDQFRDLDRLRIERDDALRIAERNRAENDKLRAERDDVTARWRVTDEANEGLGAALAAARAELADAQAELRRWNETAAVAHDRDVELADAHRERDSYRDIVSEAHEALDRAGVSRTPARPLNDRIAALAASRPSSLADKTCPHGDLTCPCPDGDLCHYEDDETTEGWPSPVRDTSLADTEQAETGTMRRDWMRPTAEMHNMANLSGVTLRRACTARSVATSGTKRRLADRLLDAGLTAAEVKEQHGWRAAEKTSTTESMQWCPDCPNGCAEGPAAVVAWVNANGGEARCASQQGDCTDPRIAVLTADGWDYAAPGDEVVKGKADCTMCDEAGAPRRRFECPECGGTRYDGSDAKPLREFTVRRAADTDGAET